MRFVNRSAGRLSRHRRGPLAGLVLLLVGLVTAGGLYTALAPAQAQDSDTLAIEVEKGRELFLVGCSSCHGLNGEGVSTLDGNNLGPSLVGVGAAAVDFQVGTGRMPMAQPGAQAPRKPATYSEEETAQLAAYVASLGPGPAIPDESDYSIEDLDDDAQRGGRRARRPDLPDQLHRLPQLRGRRRRDAPRRLRPGAARRGVQVHLRGAADRPAEHAELQQRQPRPRGEARRHRLPEVARGAARLRRLRHGRSRAR